MVSRSTAFRALRTWAGEYVVVQVADKGGDGALEVDVVLPQRIVGVDQQGLAERELGHDSYGIE